MKKGQTATTAAWICS